MFIITLGIIPLGLVLLAYPAMAQESNVGNYIVEGVKIRFMDADLKQIRFKITFENNSLEHALQMLQTIEDFEFEIEDDHVWIKPSS